MNLLADAMTGLGSVLLWLVAVLLFEEMTFGGLARLLLAPWPDSQNRKGRKNPKGEGR